MILFFLTQLVNFVFASSGGGGHHEAGIPTMVFYQAINVSIFFGILFWASKDKVRAVFQQRLADFHRLAQETEKARKDLEYKKADLQRRSDQLKTTQQQSIKDAQNEAEKFYNDEIEKSQKMAQKIAKDAEAQVLADTQKTIEKLRLETLEMSVGAAEQLLGGIEGSEKQKITQRVQQRIEGAVL
ncbi:ATP synthase F0 subunit B [bacterium]|nr:ATP synthase F0 subunit B [bacterium]